MTNAILAKDFDKCFGLGRYIIFNELRSNSKLSSGVLCLILLREEALAHILAHELRHLWRKNHPKKKDKVWGSRGQFSDRGADAYAIRKMREWRHQHNNNTAGLGSWLYYNSCYCAGERAYEGYILVRN